MTDPIELETGINDNLKFALGEAVAEMIFSSSEEHIRLIMETVNEIRNTTLIAHLNDRVIINKVWDSIRTKQDVMITLFSITATFNLHLNDVDEACEWFIGRFVPYRATSSIVDKETIDKTIPEKDVQGMFKDNLWLFFLVYASTQLRVVMPIIQQVVKSK